MDIASPVATARPEAGSRRRSTPSFVPRAALLGLVPVLIVTAIGAPYYLLPWQDRLRSSLHGILRPSGLVGQTAGLVAFFLFLFLWLYPIRKRVRLAFLGPVPRWLDAHIVAGVLMPFVGALHAGFRFSGVIGLGYFAMLVVAGSGVIGRYLYLRIPRARSGVELSREEVAARRRGLVGEIVDASGIPVDRLKDLLRPPTSREAGRGIVRTLVELVRADFARRSAIRRLVRELAAGAGQLPPQRLRVVEQLARQEIALAQQARLLEATGRVFRLWHAFHLPFAITAFVAVTIHVVVAVAFGASWIG